MGGVASAIASGLPLTGYPNGVGHYNPHRVALRFDACVNLCSFWKCDATLEAQLVARLWQAEGDIIIQKARQEDQPTGSLIYQSVVRFHCATMMVNRRLWDDYCKAMPVDAASVKIHHVGVDSSPAHGLELFGGMYYIITGMDPDTRRLQFLWSLWLAHGQSKQNMQMWLDSVQAVLTDWGTEFGMRVFPTSLPYSCNDCKLAKAAPRHCVGTCRVHRVAVSKGWSVH